jgi:hypothetical protein
MGDEIPFFGCDVSDVGAENAVDVDGGWGCRLLLLLLLLLWRWLCGWREVDRLGWSG